MRAGAAGVADGLVAVKVRYRLTPWWAKVIVVFVLSRVVTTAIMLNFAARQLPNAWTGASPGYADFASIWDGHWYYIISAVGYPSELPITADGHVGESAWAFMPAFPAVVRLLMLVTGLDFPVLAVFVSVVCALGAALVFYRLMHLVMPGSAALFAVVLFCVAPLSPILQVSYAESMHVLLLVSALFLLLERRYLMLLPVIAVMALTRPSGLAFALTLALHVGYRFVRRHREEFPVRERVASVIAAFFSGFMGIAWLLIAWAITGSPTAYTDTELAWRAAYVGYQDLVPFTPWFSAAGFWSGQWGVPLPLLVVILVILILGFFAALFTPWAKRLGVDLRLWIASYALYLLAVFFPQSSTFRLLVPLFPALGAFAVPRSPWYRIGLVLLCIAGQVAWVNIGWWVDGYDWTPP
ncbi:membrane protein [soil metagenome]